MTYGWILAALKKYMMMASKFRFPKSVTNIKALKTVVTIS